ncbi:hypothetical protein V8E53_001250 [Lactarius tabidus]
MSDPVRDLNNYLQGHQNSSLRSQFSWVLRQEGPNHQVTHHATATCEFRGNDIGHGRGSAPSLAKRDAAIQALQHLRAKGI